MFCVLVQSATNRYGVDKSPLGRRGHFIVPTVLLIFRLCLSFTFSGPLIRASDTVNPCHPVATPLTLTHHNTHPFTHTHSHTPPPTYPHTTDTPTPPHTHTHTPTHPPHTHTRTPPPPYQTPHTPTRTPTHPFTLHSHQSIIINGFRSYPHPFPVPLSIWKKNTRLNIKLKLAFDKIFSFLLDYHLRPLMCKDCVWIAG